MLPRDDAGIFADPRLAVPVALARGILLLTTTSSPEHVKHGLPSRNLVLTAEDNQTIDSLAG